MGANVLVGAGAASYPAGNWLPASTALVQMAGFGAKDYSLLSGADLTAVRSRPSRVR